MDQSLLARAANVGGVESELQDGALVMLVPTEAQTVTTYNFMVDDPMAPIDSIVEPARHMRVTAKRSESNSIRAELRVSTTDCMCIAALFSRRLVMDGAFGRMVAYFDGQFNTVVEDDGMLETTICRGAKVMMHPVDEPASSQYIDQDFHVGVRVRARRGRVGEKFMADAEAAVEYMRETANRLFELAAAYSIVRDDDAIRDDIVAGMMRAVR